MPQPVMRGADPEHGLGTLSRRTVHAEERLTLGIKLAYGAPTFAGAAMAIPIAIHMTKFYADVVLVPLGFLGIAIAVARAFDALTDPIMGWISDRTRTRWGRRRPYLILGAPLCALAFVALFSPPEELSSGGAILWFTVTFMLYFLFNTIYSIPHAALGAELTLDYHERSSLFGVREAFVMVGMLCAVILPGVLTVVLGSERMAFSTFAILFAAALVVLYTVLVLRVRERPGFVQRRSNPLVPGVRRALRNAPFRLLLVTFIFSSVPGAIAGILMPFYTTYVIQPDEPTRWLAVFLAGYFGSAFLLLPVWLRAARRFGKRPTWLASFVIAITGASSMFFVGPGEEWLVLPLVCWAGTGFGATNFLGRSIKADVIDYDELLTGKRREAQYTAFWEILPKFVLIPGAAVPIAFLGSLGYQPNVPQSPEVVLAIQGIFAFGPASCAAVAFLLAWRFPISEGVHRAIRSGIALHQEGSPAQDPLTGRVVLPPTEDAVKEDMAWYLDHFSPRELERAVARGPQVLLRKALFAASAAALVAAVVGTLVASSLRDLERAPGALAVVGVVVTGLAVTAAIFHLARIPPARAFARRGIPASTVERHLKAIPG
jgi:glycoside/pentoside/hexuronide:cation symporter, GPH family